MERGRCCRAPPFFLMTKRKTTVRILHLTVSLLLKRVQQLQGVISNGQNIHILPFQNVQTTQTHTHLHQLGKKKNKKKGNKTETYDGEDSGVQTMGHGLRQSLPVLLGPKETVHDHNGL